MKLSIVIVVTLLFHFSKSTDIKLNEYIVLSPEVKEATANNRPIVALESTVISHGIQIRLKFSLTRHALSPKL
jgi:pseudouridine-5'-phosphate glycosidase